MTDGTVVPVDNVPASRYEMVVDGSLAVLEYYRKKDVIVLAHTEVSEALKGRGLGGVLAKYALEAARTRGDHVVAACPFVQGYLRKHPEYADLVITE